MEEDNRLEEYYKNKKSNLEEVKEKITEILNISEQEIFNIEILKKGFTNNSFVFEYNKNKYIMRVPGQGTEKIINRKQEANVYSVLKGKSICENVIYIDGNTGYKISEFYENARVADSYKKEDVIKCMKKLKEFHNMNLRVEHEFNLFEKINYYEEKWQGKESKRPNYKEVKEKIFELKNIIDKFDIKKSLSHIDSLADNFLLINDDVILIDWEYSGMQDPHIDIAMFAIYAMYSKEEYDSLIDIYFEGECTHDIRLKLYCYIAVCGLLWNNWAEYKINLGEELNEYAISQFRYAEEFYLIVKEELRKKEVNYV